jgi:hypothetical protein
MKLSNLFFALLLKVTLSSSPADPPVDDPVVGSLLKSSFGEDAYVGTLSVTLDMGPAPNHDTRGICDFDKGDLRRLSKIITAAGEDSPKFLADQLEGCLLPYEDMATGGLVNDAIRNHQTRKLEILLPHLLFPNHEELDKALSFHLTVALHYSSLPAADLLLAAIGVVRNLAWLPPLPMGQDWNLAELKDFVYRHKDRLSELIPRYEALEQIWDPFDALLLIDLAEFCHEISVLEGGPPLFDPEWFLYQLLLPHGTQMGDAGKAAVAKRLVQAGVNAKDYAEFCAGKPAGLEATCAVLMEAHGEAETEGI